MFGYVNISHNTISEEDRKLYSAYYCGLCKAIGKKSELLRLGLNNDLTFLSVLLSAVIPDDVEILENKKCVIHTFKKHSEVKFSKVLDYTSDMNILLVYLKFCDDVSDEKKISSFFAKCLFSHKAKQVIKKYKKLSDEIKAYLKKLTDLEKDKSCSIDETADCFAKILEKLFVPDFVEDDNTKDILSWMGYNIGRWIYIIDAYCDIEKDKKSKSYNPFIYCDNPDIKKLTYDTLTYTLNNIANAYDLLKVYRSDTLIKHILYSALPLRQEQIFNETEEKYGSI